MQRESGSVKFPIWLLGDSDPQQWANSLSGPLDPRHPVRHNIWTPILDAVQDIVFRAEGIRLDSSDIYIRNAVGDSDIKPKSNERKWTEALENEHAYLGSMMKINKPALIFSFGAFAFEFCRRALSEQPDHRFGHWTTQKLGEEFRCRLANFSLSDIDVIPLLHRSISGGRFLSGHHYFCGNADANYFEHTASLIAKKFLEHREALHVWI